MVHPHKISLSASVRLVGNRWLAEVFTLDEDGSSVILARTTFEEVEQAQHWARETAEALEEAGDLPLMQELGEKLSQ